ncbi:MAG: hypothetical protein JST22_13735 [Bacteroidetes bacterium]|nr:hypothetical protein [Bacteroidota bacterium]
MNDVILPSMPNTTRLRAWSALLLAAIVAHGVLSAQMPDVRISPPDSPTFVLNQDAEIQSAARVGGRTLAAWGTTVPDSVAGSYHNELWLQMLDGPALVGAPRRLHGDEARPSGCVCVLNLHDRFLVLWNDRRTAVPAIRAQAVDTLGDGIGGEWVFRDSASLAGATSVWLRDDQGTYRITWGDAAGTAVRYFTGLLDVAGHTVRETSEIVQSNFDTRLTLDSLPGISFDRLDDGHWHRIHADGSIDPRAIPDRFLNGPHYVAADTSIVVIERDSTGAHSVAFYRSLFDTVPARRVAFTLPWQAKEHMALARDSTGHMVVFYDRQDAYGQPDGTGYRVGSLSRFTLMDDGHVADSTTLMTLYWWFEAYTRTKSASGTLDRATVEYGDRNCTRFTYATSGSIWYSDGTGGDWNRSQVVTIDGNGNIYTLDPAIRPYMTSDMRNPVPVSRVAAINASAVDVRLDSTTTQRVSIALAPIGQNFPQRSPALMLRESTIDVAWVEASQEAQFSLARWNGDSVVQRKPVTFERPAVNQQRGEHFEMTSTLWRWLDVCAVSYTGILWRYYTGAPGLIPEYSSQVLVPDTSGWRAIDISTLATSVGDHRVYGFDPVERVVAGTPASAIYRGTSLDGSPLWSTKVAGFNPASILPLSAKRFILVQGDTAYRLVDGAAGGFFALGPAASPVRYQRLYGSTFMRFYPDSGVDAGGALHDRSVTFEMYDWSGELKGSATLNAPGSRFDPFVYQRASDGAVFILWGSEAGVHLTVLDGGMKLYLADTVVSVTHASVRSPVCAIRGDTLFAAWEDMRNGESDIFGRAWPLPEGLRSLHRTGSRTWAGVIDLWPNPARGDLSIAWDADARQLPARIIIFDLLGREAGRQDVTPTQGVGVVNVTNLPIGVYELGVFDSQGQFLAAARFIRE